MTQTTLAILAQRECRAWNRSDISVIYYRVETNGANAPTPNTARSKKS